MTYRTTRSGDVPHFREWYARALCERAGALRARGWTNTHIDRLLGDPDSLSFYGRPMYGADRAFLAELSDPALRTSLSRSTRSVQVRGLLLRCTEPRRASPRGRHVQLDGYPWLVACKRVYASEGTPLEIVSGDGEPRELRSVKTVAAQWGDFALVKVTSVAGHGDQREPDVRLNPSGVGAH